MAIILHITSGDAWAQAQQAGLYQGDTLATEGFIHCSTRQQVVRTADKYFRGQTGLVLLCIDSELVGPEIRYEASEPGEMFPHIYGPLNVDAVIDAVPFEPDGDGLFHLPEAISRRL
jgi:uncharacterized protein (DUF952 family)